MSPLLETCCRQVSEEQNPLDKLQNPLAPDEFSAFLCMLTI